MTLSPSRASDYKRCGQLYKYRHEDKLPTEKSPAQAAGNLVHAVLEELLKRPAEDRTRKLADDLLVEVRERPGEWDDLLPKQVDVCRSFLDGYFKLEDPTLLSPKELEWWVSTDVNGVVLRGIIDRLDVDGEDWILTDYKTGRVPGENYELSAFFGLRFYALVCWRAFGKVPKEIRLLYLDGPETITLRPTEQMLNAFENQILAISRAIVKARSTGDWRPRPGAICAWCSFTEICPAWKGAKDGA